MSDVRLTVDDDDLDGDDFQVDALDTPPRRAPVAPGRVLVRGLTPDGTPIACRVSGAEAERLTADAEAQRRRARDRARLAGLFDNPAVDPAEREALRRSLSRPIPERRLHATSPATVADRATAHHEAPTPLAPSSASART